MGRGRKAGYGVGTVRALSYRKEVGVREGWGGSPSGKAPCWQARPLLG